MIPLCLARYAKLKRTMFDGEKLMPAGFPTLAPVILGYRVILFDPRTTAQVTPLFRPAAQQVQAAFIDLAGEVVKVIQDWAAIVEEAKAIERNPVSMPPVPSGDVQYRDYQPWWNAAKRAWVGLQYVVDPTLAEYPWAGPPTLAARLAEIEQLLDPIVDLSPGATVPVVSGKYVQAPNVVAVNIKILNAPSAVQNFWRVADSGKYGLVVPLYSGGVGQSVACGEPVFINFASQRLFLRNVHAA